MPAEGEMKTLRACLPVLALVAGSVFPAAVAAQDKPTLSVYTYGSFSGEYGRGEKIRAAFEAECGCTLEWVTTEDSGTLLARLKLEGTGTAADIVLGLDTSLMAEAKASGLFAPHGVDLSGLDLPIQ